MSSPSSSQTKDAEALRARVAELERKLELSRLQRTVASAANEAGTPEQAMQIAVSQICSFTDWPVGHGYLRDEDDVLRPIGAWHLSDPEGFQVFRRVTAETSFELGQGLVGRVAARGEAEWVPDVSRDPEFVRSRAAPVEVRAGLAAPLAHGDEVLGVIEFFSDVSRQPDPDLLDVISDVGRQLGIVVARNRVERELRISREKFAGIVSISAEAIISIDDQERIVHFNEGARDVFGYDPEEVLGEPVELLIPPRFRETHHHHVEDFERSEVQARRMGERREVYGIRKSGEEFPAEASISKLEVDGETIFSVVLRDVSERKRYEEELERYARELERSNRELEQFAFVASHDLQEPLRKIRSFGDRLVSRHGDELDGRARDYLMRMQGAAERMASLIQDLLAFSRITTRTNPFEPVDLGEVVDDALSDLEPRIRETGAGVKVGDLPVVEADRTQIRQLFQNVTSNALKYHREGEPPRVEVTGRVATAAGAGAGEREDASDGEGSSEPGWAVIRVRDEGIGFDPDYAERIFGVFERLHGRSAYEGTGIGLAICRKIVERHGGTITAESEPGAGATFTIRLPVRQPASRGSGEDADAAGSGECGETEVASREDG